MKNFQATERLILHLCVPELRVADARFNGLGIRTLISDTLAAQDGFHIFLFPQLSLSAYSCGDLFRLDLLADACRDELEKIATLISGEDCLAVLGLPLKVGENLLDSAAVLDGRGLIGFVINADPPARQFDLTDGMCLESIEWQGAQIPVLKEGLLPGLVQGHKTRVRIGNLPPTTGIEENELLLNLCALPALGDQSYAQQFQQISAANPGLLAVCSAGASESSANYVYSGLAQLWRHGKLIAQTRQLSLENEIVSIDLNEIESLASRAAPPVPKPERDAVVPFLFKSGLHDQYARIFEIQAVGLARRMLHTAARRMVLGLSGGADSTMALMVCCRTAELLSLDRESILAVSLPGPGSSRNSQERVKQLLDLSGVTARRHDISEAVTWHLRDIGHQGKPDITFENVQARERTKYLMNYANLFRGLVVGTGDLSEIALGWSTYNGDQMSMYNVNAGLPKTVLLRLLPWAAEAIFGGDGLELAQKVVSAPISPELQPVNADGQSEQITEQVLGPYELHDFFLWHAVGERQHPAKVLELAERVFSEKYPRDFIFRCLRRFYERFFRHQFKRAASPDGPQLFKIGLSAASAWRMPADASPALWLETLDALGERGDLA